MRRSLVCKVIDITSEMIAVLNMVGSYTIFVVDDIKETYTVVWRYYLEVTYPTWECEKVLMRMLEKYTGADSWYGVEKRYVYKMPMLKLYMDDKVCRIFFTSVWDVTGNFYATFNGYGDIRNLSGMAYMEFNFKRRQAFELSEFKTQEPGYSLNKTKSICKKYSLADGVDRLIDLFCQVCLLDDEKVQLEKRYGERCLHIFENGIKRMEQCRIKC